VPHVGVERLAAGDAQHDRAEHDEPVRACVAKNDTACRGLSRDEHRAGYCHIAITPRTASVLNHSTITGPNTLADARGRPSLLNGEQVRAGSRTVIGITSGSKRVGGDLEALDGAEHGDGRRDDAVAVEQRGAEEHHAAIQPMRPLGLGDAARLGHQGEQRHDAALTLVVGPHDEREVLDRHDHDQRPEHQRQQPQHVLVRSGLTPCGSVTHSLSA
jgi:hypothetical protein